MLSPNSLIAKIWLAWGEEQQNVLFTVKRIKTERREAGREAVEEGEITRYRRESGESEGEGEGKICALSAGSDREDCVQGMWRRNCA